MGLAYTRAPGNIVRIAVTELIEVLEVQADDALGRSEFLDGFEGIDAGTCPVPGIGTGTDSFTAPFADLKHCIGIPVM